MPDQERFIKEHLKDGKPSLRDTIKDTFRKYNFSKKIIGKKTSVDIIDDFTTFDSVDKDIDYIQKIKKEMWENMMNQSPSPTPKRMKNINIAEDFLEQEKRQEQEKELEEEKPTLKLFEIQVWAGAGRTDRELRGCCHNVEY